MASKETVTTLYQCSECDHCSQNLEEATLHAVQAHGEEKEDIQEDSDEDYDLDRVIIKKNISSSDDEYPSTSHSTYVAADESGNHSGYRKAELWPGEAIKLLIQCVGGHYHDLSNKLRKRKDIWEEIHRVVSKSLPDITVNQCEQKWRNLLNSHKKYLATKNVYGKARGKKPDNFDDIAAIVDGGDALTEKSLKYSIENDTIPSYRSARIRERKSKERDSLSNALKNLLNNDSQKVSLPASDNQLLTRLITILEKREAANAAFQKEVIEIEREKLSCIQKFIENKERHNARRLQLMREYMYFQKSKKRRIDED